MCEELCFLHKPGWFEYDYSANTMIQHLGDCVFDTVCLGIIAIFVLFILMFVFDWQTGCISRM